jgi:hypothetical protein
MEKNWERFAKVISRRLVIDDGPLYPTHMYIILWGSIYTQLVSYRLCRQPWFRQLAHLQLHEGRVESSLPICYLLTLMDGWEFVHTPEITSSKAGFAPRVRRGYLYSINPLLLCGPLWTSTHQCTIHWMPVLTHLWMNLNWVSIWFHRGNQFHKK